MQGIKNFKLQTMTTHTAITTNAISLRRSGCRDFGNGMARVTPPAF
jgi:hypothetical protein